MERWPERCLTANRQPVENQIHQCASNAAQKIESHIALLTKEILNHTAKEEQRHHVEEHMIEVGM